MDDAAGRTGTKGIQSIEIGAGLIAAVVEARVPLRLKDLAERAGLSPSKARMYLVSLVRSGLIEQDARGHYGPGPAALRLGLAALAQSRVLGSARALVKRIGDETGHPVLLTAWDGSAPVILLSSENPDGLPIGFRTGAQTPLWDTATGMVFLAFLPRAVALRMIEAECDGAARAAVLDSAAGVRARGIAIFDSVRLNAHATLSGYAAAAAPILSADGGLECVVTLLCPQAEGPAALQAMTRLLAARAQEVSRGPAIGPA